MMLGCQGLRKWLQEIKFNVHVNVKILAEALL